MILVLSPLPSSLSCLLSFVSLILSVLFLDLFFFPPHWGSDFPSFCILIVLSDARHFEFYLVRTSSLFWDTVNSFGAVWPGNACFWAFWRQNQSSLFSRDDLPPVQRQCPCEYSYFIPSVLWNLSTLTVETQTDLWWLWELFYLPLSCSSFHCLG